MDRTAIVTGGTGGLGAAVVQAFLDAGWRAVGPWVAESELARLPEREGLEHEKADLFDGMGRDMTLNAGWERVADRVDAWVRRVRSPTNDAT